MSTEIKKFEIVLQNSRQEFYAGNQIEGNVVLDLADSLLLKTFSISFEGTISCRFGRKGKKEHLGDDHMYHFTEAHRSGFAQICNDEVTLVKELEDSMIEHVVVESGEKSYPFSFRSHYRFPGSFQDKFGNVIYGLKATVESTGDLNEKFELPVTLIGIVDANRAIYMEGFSGSAYKSFGLSPCFSSSSIEITGQVDRVCYLPGDTIFIDAMVENCTDKKQKCLKAKLIQRSRYHYKKKTYIVEKVVAKIESGSIPKMERFKWKREPFEVPQTVPNLYVELIEVKYELRLQVSHVTAAIPIVIGTIPHKSQKTNRHSLDSGDASQPNGKISESLRIITNDANRPLLIKEEDID